MQKKAAGGWLLATFLSCVITAYLARYIGAIEHVAAPRAAVWFGAPALALVVLLVVLFRRKLRDTIKKTVRENVPPSPS
jgi:hypothetical protein